MDTYFAPLQGFTEDAYRRIHNKTVGGVTAYYTPFIRLEHGEIRSKDLRDIRPEWNEGVNVVPQVIASSNDELQTVLAAIPDTYKHIDINMGCPFPLQTRHGRGAGLLSKPEVVKSLILPNTDHIAYSVKMRLGLNDANEWRQVLPILNDMPLEHIVVHPRIATQQYKGEVDMEQFEALLSASQHPVIYNGDITTIEDITRLEANYGEKIKGVMIGRGLLARPTLAWEYQNGQTLSDRQVINKAIDLHAQLLAHYEKVIPGEDQRLNKVRSFWEYMEPLLGRKAWKKVMKAGNMKNYLRAISEL